MNNLEKSGQKITATLFASQSLFSAALIMSFTVSSIIMVELAGSANRWTAGIPPTLMLIGAATMAYPMGRFMDRFGRRPGLTIGYLWGIFGCLIAGWAVMIQSLPLFLAGVLCLGFNRGANDLGRYAAAEANPAHKRARAISLVVLAGTVGSISGPILIESITRIAAQIEIPTFSALWFAAGLLLGIAVVVLNVLLRPDPQTIARQLNALEETENAIPSPQGEGRAYREIFSHPHTKVATGAMICGQLAMVAVMTMTPVYMDDHHHAITAISWVIMAHTLGMFGLSFVSGWLVDKLGQPRIILAGGLILALACLLAPLWNSVPWLALSLFLLGLGWNFCFVAGSALLTAVLQRNEKGRVQGITDAMVYIAAGTGGVGSGLIWHSFGYLILSWLSIIIALVPVLLVIFLTPMRAEPLLEVPLPNELT